MLGEYARRRETMIAGLRAIPGIRCLAPEGAFYAFADVSELYGSREVAGSADFCERLLVETGVAAVPGDAFGADDCVRLSFATSLRAIEEALRRIAAWVAAPVRSS
jgi:aspartate aminotransferase